MIEAFSAIDNETYCIVTPWECRIAIVIDAIWIPHLTMAVAKPLLRLWIVALYHPSCGAKDLSILAMKAPVLGTILLWLLRTSSGLAREIFSP